MEFNKVLKSLFFTRTHEGHYHEKKAWPSLFSMIDNLWNDKICVIVRKEAFLTFLYVFTMLPPPTLFFIFQSLSESQGQTKDKNARKKGAAAAQQGSNAAAKVFARYDVVETSYHFYSDRIDLHLCDDPGGSK